MEKVIIFSIFSFLFSLIGTKYLKEYLERKKVFDIPNERSSHTKPMPKGGGWIIVIFLMILFLLVSNGGGGGIRTHETLARLPVFKTGRFNHSRTPPRVATQSNSWLREVGSKVNQSLAGFDVIECPLPHIRRSSS